MPRHHSLFYFRKGAQAQQRSGQLLHCLPLRYFSQQLFLLFFFLRTKEMSCWKRGMAQGSVTPAAGVCMDVTARFMAYKIPVEDDAAQYPDEVIFASPISGSKAT
jgi:hypothetical protein